MRGPWESLLYKTPEEERVFLKTTFATVAGFLFYTGAQMVAPGASLIAGAGAGMLVGLYGNQQKRKENVSDMTVYKAYAAGAAALLLATFMGGALGSEPEKVESLSSSQEASAVAIVDKGAPAVDDRIASVLTAYAPRL